MNKNKKLAVGVDIGGTNVKILIFDESNNTYKTASYPTNSQLGPTVFMENATSCIDTLAKKHEGEIKSIGIGCTGPVDIIQGVVQNPYTLPGLEDFNLIAAFSDYYSVPIVVDNDANTTHLGEVFYQQDASDNSLLLTFGTGLGVSARVNGMLFRTPGGIHPEMGHIPTSVIRQDPCYCGHRHCAEHILSGNAINKRATQLGAPSPESLLDSPRGATFKRELVDALFDTVITFTIIFHSEVIYIGGGMQTFFEQYLLKETQERLNDFLPLYGRTILKGCKAKEAASSLGAALLPSIGHA